MSDQQCRYDPRSCQSLLGYGKAAHERSGGVCAYCGLGKRGIDFDIWRQLSVDHVIPARLFPGEGRTLQSVFPNLPKAELSKLSVEINRINLVTACNFCNSMTSRMKRISADGILSPEDYEEVTSVNDEPVQAMLCRLQEHVGKVLPVKKDYVRKRLAELRRGFEADIEPELRDGRKRPEVKDEVLTAIDLLKKKLLNCRAYFPKLDDSLVGQQKFQTPSFYENCGYRLVFEFPKPLTDDDISHLNAIGHFINQSYIVFLCSVLEFHRVLEHKEEIDKRLEGAEDVQLLRKLRHVIAHRSGEYDASNQEHRQLYERLQRYYKLDQGMDPQKAEAFPLPIDQVLLPMTEGCRTYAEAMLKQGSPDFCDNESTGIG